MLRLRNLDGMRAGSWGPPPVIDKGPALVDNLLVSGKGREYGTWIDTINLLSRDSQNGGAPDPGYNAGQMNEQPVYIIESVFREELELDPTTIGADIDINSFDIIGNSTNGLRKDWKFARSIYDFEDSKQTLTGLCFESFCASFNSHNKIKLVALDKNISPNTLTTSNFLFRGGEPQIKFLNTIPNEAIKTDFILNYRYDYGSGIYKGKKFVKANGNNLASEGLNYQTKCLNAETRYKLKPQLWEYSSLWIRDDITAELFIKKVINWLIFKKSFLEILCDLSALKYERGDQLKIDYSPMLPTNMNNNLNFIVVGKAIDPNLVWVDLQLMQFEDYII